MLKLTNVTKTYGNIIALDDISFEIKDGEFVFVTGPSGSGKTTLMRLILREILPDSGEILFGGEDITKLKGKEIPLLRQKIGVVFQDFKVLPERTLRENVEVALAVTGLPRNEWKSRVDHVLELVELSDRAEFFPSQLAGGELQRTSLARALVVNPTIILADEPTGNLDWETAEKLMDLFDLINKEGKTVIMATHHKLIVDKLGKRQIKIKPGGRKKEEEKDKEEVKEKGETSDKIEKTKDKKKKLSLRERMKLRKTKKKEEDKGKKKDK